MASNFSLRSFVILVLAFSLIAVQGILGDVECENLRHRECAFAVSKAGKRCVLEKQVKRTGEEAYTCRSSEIEADKLKNHIETDQCIKACGLNRKSFGISSDSLLDSHFTQMLCSPQCYQSCQNIVDLYFDLAAGEGVFLPKLCKAEGTSARRGMAEIQSSGIVAPGPVHSNKHFTAIPEEPFNNVEFTAEPAATPGYVYPPY